MDGNLEIKSHLGFFTWQQLSPRNLHKVVLKLTLKKHHDCDVKICSFMQICGNVCICLRKMMIMYFVFDCLKLLESCILGRYV